jgi:hypothetical protein
MWMVYEIDTVKGSIFSFKSSGSYDEYLLSICTLDFGLNLFILFLCTYEYLILIYTHTHTQDVGVNF